jgi:ribosomal protein L11 methyltransferase
VRLWPALDILDPDDLLTAALDDFAPTAIEERDAGVRVFFASAVQRDAARAALHGHRTAVLDVSDEDWAARSQRNLVPVTIGRIRVVPRPELRRTKRASASDSGEMLEIVIEPSMGFGTGHHATTRLCLAALQAENLERAAVLDVGAGSGILAIAAAALGAAAVHGIDCDADAVETALANRSLNRAAAAVTFAVADISIESFLPADFVLANLTGAHLVKCSGRLQAATRPGGTLVVSGILDSEEVEVREAFRDLTLADRRQQDEWICLTLKKD